MITAPISEFKQYVTLHPAFQKVEEFLKSYTYGKPVERIYIDGDKLFVIPALDNAKSKENALLEAHNRYIDIQICLEGHEIMGWQSRSKCIEPKSAFNTEKDIIFYNDKPITYFAVPAGSFAIFFPDDCHAPLIGEGLIKKIIFKVEVI